MLAEHYGIKLYDRNLIDMLANHPNALRIFIYAPVEFKIPHVKENYNILTDALPPLRRFRASSPPAFRRGRAKFFARAGERGFSLRARRIRVTNVPPPGRSGDRPLRSMSLVSIVGALHDCRPHHRRETPITETELPRESSVSERKKDSADTQFSRQALIVARFSRVAMLLRKPRKRSGAEFF